MWRRAHELLERLACARAIDAACREIGFFAMSGHGVPEGLVDDLRGRAHQFLALPTAARTEADGFWPVDLDSRLRHGLVTSS